jgi:NTE family protein
MAGAEGEPTGDRPRGDQPRIALVLGGGGLKGFGHIGVLRALDELGIVPTVYVGTSIGALIASARVAGMTTGEMAQRAESLRKRDIFRLNHLGMLLDRMKSRSIYLEEPLRDLCRAVCPPVKFSELGGRLLVNTVDLDRGTQIIWGLPGLEDVHVEDAVYASCALPGYFPPARIGNRSCTDGGVVDNLPVAIAAAHADLVIAVDVGSAEMVSRMDFAAQGFGAVYLRSATIMMRALQQFPLERWSGPPMVLVRPKLGKGGWLSFAHTAQNIEEGYRAAKAALADIDQYWDRPDSIFPRQRFEVRVDRERCTGCTMCAALSPAIMGMDSSGKAFARTRHVEWSPADRDFVDHCPTGAIEVTKLGPLGPVSLPEIAAVRPSAAVPIAAEDAVLPSSPTTAKTPAESDAA